MLQRRKPLARKVIERQLPHSLRKVRKGRTAKTTAERLHHARVALMPCIACGNWPVEVHHVVSDGYSRITRNHKLVLPLCPADHREGPNAVHRIGTPAFNELHGIDQLERAKRLWEEHRD